MWSLKGSRCDAMFASCPMKKFPTILISCIIVLSMMASLAAIWDGPGVSDSVQASEESMGISSQTAFLLDSVFTENQGQVENDDVLFTTSSSGGRLAFSSNSYSMHLTEKGASDVFEQDGSLSRTDQQTMRDTLVAIFFIDANDVIPVGRDPLPWYSHYFSGNDSSEWMTDVPNFGQIIYENLWDGIDLVYTLRDSGLKYDIIIHPGADPGDIRFRVEGHVELLVDGAGTLVVRTDLGDPYDIRDSNLMVFYEDDSLDSIPARFHLIDHETYTFRLQDWDHTRTVIIDPLVYSTFLGGSEWDLADGITVDDHGCAYVIGYTDSSDFPTTPGAYDTTSNGEYDVFITKLSQEGDALEYSTYLGQGSDWSKFDIEVDGDGYAYVVGSTSNANFPTTVGAYDTTHGGSNDAFVTKLSPSGDSLVYSTFIGDTKSELGYAIDIDDDGYAYVTGCTSSTDFPTTSGAYDTTYNFQRDVFVTKLSQAGDSLVYSTFLGSNKNEDGKSIAVDEEGYAYVTGGTYSSGFPSTNGAYDETHNGDWDGYIAKLSQSGDSLEYSTFLGGSAGEEGSGLDIDDDGNTFITGRTSSSDFPTTEGAYDRNHNGGYGDVFVTKLATAGGSLLYSTFIGGGDKDSAEDIAIGGEGYACVIGYTHSDDFPVVAGSYDTTFNGGDGGNDIFVLNLRPSGSTLEYSTFLGGSNDETGLAIAVDGIGNAFVTGDTASSDFPTSAGAYDTSIDGYSDTIITKLSVYLAPIAIIDTISPNPALDTDLVSFEGHSHDDDSIQRYVWRSSHDGELHNGSTAEFETDSLSIGEHSIFFRVQDDQGEWSDEVTAVLVITERPLAHIDSITPNPAFDSDEIRFEGHGTDDGTIERFAWRSGSDGEFYNGTDADFTNSALSNGTHDIYLRVLDNDGFWSDDVSTTLAINGKPRCEILEISHSTALNTDTVIFKGVGSDDGTITRFEWTSSLDDELYNDTMDEFSTDSLSLGDHTIHLKVQDDSGTWSEVASRGLIITERPIAWIDTISPNPALESVNVTFTGHGTDDGSIEQFVWRSSIDDELRNGSTSDFSSDALSNGTHEISFLVRDEHGFWSVEVTTTLVIHRRPVAVIGSILPTSPALDTDTIIFNGSGNDDGGISRFLWDSDLHGELYNGTNAMFTHEGLMVGTHTISLRVQDTYGIWSDEVFETVTVTQRPEASIDSVSPNPALNTDSVTFTGSGTDDGSITGYSWWSDLIGELSNGTEATLHRSALSSGTHTISLRVRDDEGIWSEAVTTILLIHTPPTALIHSITPSRADEGDSISFQGNGTDDGTISRYVWSSNLDGELFNGTQPSFASTTLTPGQHTISFAVMDDHGVWSSAVTSEVVIDDADADPSDSMLFENIGPLPLIAYIGLLVIALLLGAVGMRKGKDEAGGTPPPIHPSTQSPPMSAQQTSPVQPPSVANGSWACPACGNHVESKYAFCLSCGYRKTS